MINFEDHLTFTEVDVKNIFPNLGLRTNKGDMGRVLAVCGSYDPCGLSMCGAAYFCAKAAYRTGAGIVEVFTPRENYMALSTLVPEAIFSLYGYDLEEERILESLELSVKKSNTVVLGCGLGRGRIAEAIVKRVLETVDCPLVIDADGLNIMSEHPEWFELLSADQKKRTVITPHPGEMQRLCGKGIADILDDTVGTAKEFAAKTGVVCLLKDHNSVITDGMTVYVNKTGNPGMASAGMGDVLSGVLGAILARMNRGGTTDTLIRVAAGAFIHGRAGDLSINGVSEYSLNASDLLSQIRCAIAP